MIKVINESRAYYLARFTPLLYYSLEKLSHYFWWLGMTFVYNSLLFYTTFTGLCSALAAYVVLKGHEINQNVFYLLHRRDQKILAVCFLKIESNYRQLGNFFCWNVHTSFYLPLYIKISFALIIRDNWSSTFKSSSHTYFFFFFFFGTRCTNKGTLKGANRPRNPRFVPKSEAEMRNVKVHVKFSCNAAHPSLAFDLKANHDLLQSSTCSPCLFLSHASPPPFVHLSIRRILFFVSFPFPAKRR